MNRRATLSTKRRGRFITHSVPHCGSDWLMQAKHPPLTFSLNESPMQPRPRSAAHCSPAARVYTYIRCVPDECVHTCGGRVVSATTLTGSQHRLHCPSAQRWVHQRSDVLTSPALSSRVMTQHTTLSMDTGLQRIGRALRATAPARWLHPATVPTASEKAHGVAISDGSE